MADSESFTELVLELAEEFVGRYRRGERPRIAEYVERYPRLAAQIRDVFPAIAMVEKVAIDDDSLEQPPSQVPAPELSRIGDYRIIREVGRGGMGIVYEAEQVSLGRRVAVKVLPRSLFHNDRVRRRFDRESKAAGKLHHTNIVPVFGVGEEEGLHYYVMQFIQGLGLDQVMVELRRIQDAESPASPRHSDIENRASVVAACPMGAATASVSLDVMARSLLEGRFGDTLIFPSDQSDVAGPAMAELPSAKPAVSGTSARGDDTCRGSLSDTGTSAGFGILGTSETTLQKQGKAAYWRSVARIGVQVADAIQHAHHQGIIHRDIKPSNLLLDTLGNIWVTDFGLAKASDQQDLTHTGDILGTLRYMAPEQFEGRADHRSDTYSLGLTLYEMLVLRSAFPEKDKHRLMKQVTSEAPPSLKSIDPQLPTDLTTVIQKAIDRDPAHRYQSAQELREDLSRFLRDEPILARRISPATRFARWCRRNPVVAGLTTALMLILVTVAVAALFAAVRFQGLAARNALLVREKGTALEDAQTAQKQADDERLLAQAAQSRAEKAQEEAEVGRDTEKRLREEAERQRDRANTNANLARRAVDQYLSKITDSEMLSVPGMQPLRQELLAEALRFYEEFAKEQTEDPQLQVELALAQFRLAVIQRELGNAEASKAANAKAIEQLESLHNRGLGGTPVLSALMDAWQSAARHADVSRLAEEVLKANPREISILSTLAESYNSQALDQKDKTDIAAALALHQKAFDIRRRLVEEHPNNPEFNAEIGSTINNIGVLLGEQKQTQDALAMFQLALTYDEKAVQLAPQSILWNRWNAIGCRNVAHKLRELGQIDEALTYFTRVVQIRKRLVFQNPAVSSLRSELYQDMLVLADHQKLMGLTTESNRSFRDAREILTQIPRETPAELFQLALVYASLATPPEAAGIAVSDEAEAADERLRNANLAMDTLRQAVDKGWASPADLKNYPALAPLRERDDFRKLANVVETVAEANQLLAAEAVSEQEKLANQQKAAEIPGRVAAENPQQRQHQRALATTLHAMGVVQTGLKQFAKAEKSLQQAIEMRDRVRETKPDDSELMLDWLTSRVAMGQLLWQQGRFPEAHQLWQECLVDLEGLDETAARNEALKRTITDLEGSVYNRYGEARIFESVQKFLFRNLVQHRIVGYRGGTQTPSDGEFSAAILLQNDRESARRYFEQLNQLAPSFGPGLFFEHAFLLQGLNILDARDITPDASIRELRNFLEDKPASHWSRQHLLFTEYRLGTTRDLDQRLNPLTTGGWTPAHYMSVLAAHHRGDLNLADQRWKAAEKLKVDACHQLLGVGPLQKGVDWWHHAACFATRRLAAEVIAGGQRISEDPWLHLVQARGYALIGEMDQAEEQVTLAADSAQNDPDIFVAIAELRQKSDSQAQDVEKSWSRAIAAAGNDPLPLIKRGRWYLERGDTEKAEADFAKAAEMTPNELNKFLEAGWWVVGPYPAEIREFCPPELDAHPSKPVHIIDPGAGLSDEPVRWRQVGTGDSGLVNLDMYPGGKGAVTVYALAPVYSPKESTATLCLASSKDARIWVNGELVRHFTPGTSNYWSFDPERIPFVLRQGLNLILVKGSADSRLTVRLGDHPYDRGMELARFGEWKQAADLIESGIRRNTAPYSSEYPWRSLAAARLAAGDPDAARRIYLELIQELRGTTNIEWKWGLVQIATMAPGITDSPEEVIAFAETLRSGKSFQRIAIPIAYLRAGRWQEVLDFLETDEECRETMAEPLWLLAVAHQKLGHTAAADKYMQKLLDNNQRHARDWATRYWLYSPYLHLLLTREAALQVTGSAIEIERSFTAFYEQRRADRERFSPDTFDFDSTIYVYPHAAHLYVARAKRLAELGRIPEAEADFNKAVELEPNDIDVLQARCLYRDDTGQIELAADDAWQIYSIGFGDQYDVVGSDFEGVLADREAVVLELLRRHRQNVALHRIRGDYLAYRGRWKEAREAYTTGDPYWTHTMCAGALSVLLDDRNGLTESLQRLKPLLEQTPGSQGEATFNRAWVQVLSELPEEQADLLVQELQQEVTRTGLNWRRDVLGVAYLRAGRYQEAITEMNATGPRVLIPHCPMHFAPLAMAYWHSGEKENAQHYLNISSQCLKWTHQFFTKRRSSGGVRIGNMGVLIGYALHREALKLMRGPDVAEAEFAALFSPLVEHKSRGLTSRERLERYWNKAVEAAEDNPLPLISRGRWHLECGEQEKAEADFAKAAELTPNELNRFLEAGWWVVGPYPSELKQFCPPELDPDPSRPVHVIDPATGLSEEPVHWQAISTGPWGKVHLAAGGVRKEGSSFYGFNCIYTPDERVTILMIGRNERLRIFLNGQLLEDYEPDGLSALPTYEQYHRIPVVLQPGQNRLLVKTTSPVFTVRLADSPRDRTLLLAEQRRFTEAVQALERVDAEDRFEVTGGVFPHAIMFLLGSENHEWYEQGCQVEFDWSRAQTADARHVVAALCALKPNDVFTRHQEQMVQHAEVYLQHDAGGWALTNAALVNYRAGRYARAGTLLDQAGWNHYTLPMSALLQHHAGAAVLAEQFLNEAIASGESFLDSCEHCDRSIFDKAPTPFHWWHDWERFLSLLGEAEQAIRHETTQTEVLRQRSEVIHKQLWEKSSEMAPFDLVLLHQSRDSSGTLKFPGPCVSRGKRCLELGRLDEAERDFNTAIELKPHDRDLLVERARLHARRGNAAQAAADLDAARKVSMDQGMTPGAWQSVVDLEFLQLPEIGLQIASHLQERPSLLFCELLVRLDRNDTDGVRRLISRLRLLGPIGRANAGAGALLTGDRELYEQICSEAIQSDEDPGQLILLLQLGMPRCTSPDELLKRIEELYPKLTGNPLAAPALGLARFRAGQYDLALQTLEPAARKASPWQESALSWPALAMTYHSLRRTDEAKALLHRTDEWLALHRDHNRYRLQTFGDHNIGTGEYVIVLLLQNEAKARLAQPVPAR